MTILDILFVPRWHKIGTLIIAKYIMIGSSYLP